MNNDLYNAVLSSFAVICLTLLSVNAASAKDVDCLACHEQLAREKVVHAALQMGCTTCHTAIDAREVPHKKTNAIAKGLSSSQPDLCFGCHDKKSFMSKKVVHAALGMGCTGCHNPHSSRNPKLLKAEMPDLCFGCHDKSKFAGKFIHAPVGIGMCTNCHSPHQSDNAKLLVKTPPTLCFDCHEQAGFSKKNVHAPVAGGMCLDCHGPHVSDEFALLKKEPVYLCLDCHPNVRKVPHAVSGFFAAGHPIGIGGYKGKKKSLDDPARPGKKFYCGSCHNPHSSDSASLFRYEASTSMGLCTHCHKM